MQELFFKKEDFPFNLLLAVTNFWEKRLSKKGRLLYYELLRKSYITQSDRFFVSYKALEGNLKHSHEYFRSAFEELENKGYAYRENKNNRKEFFVKIIREKINHDLESEFIELEALQADQLQQSKEGSSRAV